MVHGPVPVSVTGIETVCGPQTAIVAGMVTVGGGVTVTFAEPLPLQPPDVWIVTLMVSEPAGTLYEIEFVPAPVRIVPPGTVQLYVAPAPAPGTVAVLGAKAQMVDGVVI